jgi:hypothetical protein
MQPRHQTHDRQAAVPQPIGLPSHDPPPLLLVATAQQQIELRMRFLVRVLPRLGTMRTLTLMDHSILHNPFSHPWTGKRIIQDFVENWKSFLDGS